MKTPKITEKKVWTARDVRNACIRNELYTLGDCGQYDRMLDCVRNSYPDTENLYLIARDIQKHSKGQTVSNVMFILANEAVKTCYEVEGEDGET